MKGCNNSKGIDEDGEIGEDVDDEELDGEEDDELDTRDLFGDKERNQDEEDTMAAHGKVFMANSP